MTRAPCPTIVELRPYRGGCVLKIQCTGCAQLFESEQDAIGGLAFGRHACPRCAALYELWPDDFVRFVLRQLEGDFERTVDHVEAATELTERWHRSPAFSELLRHRGIDLGPPTERELFGCISMALCGSSEGRPK